jgi:hypothetical protein
MILWKGTDSWKVFGKEDDYNASNQNISKNS